MRYKVKLLVQLCLGASSAFLEREIEMPYPPVPDQVILAFETEAEGDWDIRARDVSFNIRTGATVVSPKTEHFINEANYKERIAYWEERGFRRT